MKKYFQFINIFPSFYIRLSKFFDLLHQCQFLKAGNYLLTNFNMITRPDYTTNFPIILVVEPGNVCNLRCALCATGQRNPHRPRSFLTYDNFKNLLDQIGKYLVYLDLYNWGEPLLNKDIFKMIAYAKKYHIHTEMSSNLNYFNPTIANQLISSGLDRLICSIHGGSPRTYSKYMIGGNYQQVIKNLKYLIKIKKKYKVHKPIIKWRFVVFKHNQHEIEKTKAYAKKIGVDEFETLPMKHDIGFDIKTTKMSIRSKKDWVSTIPQYNIYDIKTQQRHNKQLDCYWPWEIISIGAYGGVQPCCVFYDQKWDFGNAFQMPFWDVWNSKIYQTARHMLRLKKVINSKIICGPCLKSGFLAK